MHRLFAFLIPLLLFNSITFAQKSKVAVKRKPKRVAKVNQPIVVYQYKAALISGVAGVLFRYENFPSKFLPPHTVDVWVPSGYAQNRTQKYSVLYMNDGQNLFRASDATGGVEWRVDETLERLIYEKRARPTIVVGIWSNERRVVEFSPRKALDIIARRSVKPSPLIKPAEGESDKYLRFLVTEVKPFIDKTYRTKTEADETFVMGSSMGGLMALYALGEYPNTFGGAAGLSAQFMLADGIFLDYLKIQAPSPKNHKIYLDSGSLGYDAKNSQFQKSAEKILKNKGFKNGKSLRSLYFEGAAHDESAWQNRVETPLVFLLKN